VPETLLALIETEWLHDGDIGAAEMALRAAVVYVGMVLMVRVSKMRFMGRATAFDVIVGILLGSIASRAITGNAPFWPALGAAATLLLAHWAMSWITYRWHTAGSILKGRATTLIRDGLMDQQMCDSVKVSRHDLMSAVRVAGLTSLDQVAEARLERSGEISVGRKFTTDVVEVTIDKDVKTVRLLVSH
jgi:uncharacterized membrane protein YcaP (DUF421 family)